MTMFWYRYVDHPTAAPLDEYDRPIGRGGVQVHCERYAAIKETPCGVWLQLHDLDTGCKLRLSYLGEDRRWIRKDSRKRFACPTKKEALESFRARKRKQASIYRARAADADRALAEAERKFGEGSPDWLAA